MAIASPSTSRGRLISKTPHNGLAGDNHVHASPVLLVPAARDLGQRSCSLSGRCFPWCRMICVLSPNCGFDGSFRGAHAPQPLYRESSSPKAMLGGALWMCRSLDHARFVFSMLGYRLSTKGRCALCSPTLEILNHSYVALLCARHGPHLPSRALPPLWVWGRTHAPEITACVELWSG